MGNYFFGEFFGTMILIIFGAGVVANVVLKKSRANGGGDGWIVITAGWAFAVLFGVIIGVATGGAGELSPAVTFFKLLMGVYTVPVALTAMACQILGAIVGSAIVWLAYLPHWEITEDKGAKLGVFSTSPAVRGNDMAALLCEVIATTVLLIALFSLGHKLVVGDAGMSPGFGNYLVAVVIWAMGLSLGGPTGYAMNPARDLGPRIAHAILPIAGKGGSDWGYAWVPVVGPIIGSGLAFVICKATGII